MDSLTFGWDSIFVLLMVSLKFLFCWLKVPENKIEQQPSWLFLCNSLKCLRFRIHNKSIGGRLAVFSLFLFVYDQEKLVASPTQKHYIKLCVSSSQCIVHTIGWIEISLQHGDHVQLLQFQHASELFLSICKMHDRITRL